MPESTYTRIADVTVSTPVNSITISSIPQNYKHLVLSGFCSSTTESVNFVIRVNNDSSLIYTRFRLSTNNTAGIAANNAQLSLTNIAKVDALSPMAITGEFIDYSSSVENKMIFFNCGNASQGGDYTINEYGSTSPITSISMLAGTGGSALFAIGSTFSLFGLVG